MLTQASDVTYAETPTALEAALLEADEIKRLDPPYNVQLRLADRRAWFASRDFAEVVPSPDPLHRVGPLPSRFAVAGLAAMTKLKAGVEPTAQLRGAALGVPPGFAPERALFDEAWARFAPRIPLLDAARALHPFKEESPEDEADVWTATRVLRYLGRTLAGEGLLVRRARLLSLLSDARVAFHENGVDRVLGAKLSRHPRPLLARQSDFDAATYDRLRVLATELRRVHLEGGHVAIEIGAHRLPIANLFSAL
jgi:hypothetical protein